MFEALKKYAVFNGRARRKEFWLFYLFLMIVIMVMSVCYMRAFGTFFEGQAQATALGYDALVAFMSENQGTIVTMSRISLLFGLIYLGLGIPFLAVYVRRLHDVNKSWRNILWCLTIVGVIPVFIWLCKDSDPGENKYGPNPKA